MKSLSPRDQKVLQLLSEGLADHEVCRELRMSPNLLRQAIERIEQRATVETEDAGRFFERALRKRAENRIVSMEARFQALKQIIPQAVLIVDGRSGIIKDANALACQLFGFTEGELVGKKVEELVPDEHRAVHTAYRLGFLASIRKREMGYHPPIYGLRSDGTTVEVAIALTATTADDDVMVVCAERAQWTAPAAQRDEAARSRLT